MKNTLAAALLFAGSLFSYTSCTNTSTDASQKATGPSLQEQLRKDRIAHNQKIFNEARKNNDDYAALNATYALLADDTANNAKHLDTLAAIYVRLNMAGPAMKVADRILEKDPNNEKMLDLKATGNLSMGKTDEAMNLNRKLYEKENKLKYLFKMASIQLESRNFKDLEQTIVQIEKHPDLKTDSLEVPTDIPGQIQKVPSQAAVVYLRGLVAGEKQNFPEAKRKFKQALNIYPKFVMAQKYLEVLNNPQMQQGR